METLEKSVDLIGTITLVVWQNPAKGNYIFSMRCPNGTTEKVLAVSSFPLRKGIKLKMTGFHRTSKYGREFVAKTVQELTPSDVKGLIDFLKAKVDGIGDVTARRLVEKFGQELPNVLTKEPEKIKQLDGMTEKKYEQIVNSWKATETDRNTILFLTKLGFSVNRAVRIREVFGSNTVEKVMANAYILLDVDGVGITQADKAFFNLGGKPEDSKRVYAFIRYAIIEASHSVGHVFLYANEVYDWILKMARSNALVAIPGLTPARVLLHLDSFKEESRLMKEGDRIYLDYLHHAEKESAEQLSLRRFKTTLPEGFPIKEFVSSCEEEFNIKFSPEQRVFLEGFFDHSVHVLTGKPGTGKSTVVRALVKLLKLTNLTFSLCAPTGMAARRLAQLSEHETYTLHRYLGATGTGWLFNADSPRQDAVVIVDEMSMVDQILLYRLLDGTNMQTRFVFIGDIEQLPSVGPGNVLHELIDSGVFNVVRLSRIFRQDEDSLIVENAHRISSGQELIYEKEKGFVFGQLTEKNLDRYLEALQDRVKQQKVQTFMILSPKHKGDFGVTRINQILQGKLNPPDGIKREIETSLYIIREGDKVVICKNDYSKGVVNGDQGLVSVIDLENKKLVLAVEEVGSVTYEYSELINLKLAYCLSVHKSQGSQAEWVVVVVMPEHKILLSRRLFYTAVTRAQKKVVILGDNQSVTYSIANTKVDKRNSRLGELLKAYCGAEENAGGLSLTHKN